MGDSNSSLFQNLLGTGTSLAGAGLGIYNQQQQYSMLQNALNTIGPTQLSSNTLSGPGGLTTGYNPQTGAGAINLGSLNPAFSGLGSAAGAGANAYSAGLPSFLSGNAMSTLSPAMSTLGGAYGNYNTGMSAANTQLGSLGDFNTTYNNMLQAQYGQLAPGIQQQAFGLQNTLFGNGVADSTGAASGSLAAANFGRGVGQAQSTAQLNAFQQALAQQNSAATNYGSLSSSANNILSNAFSNFGNTNQLISGLNTAGLNNATTAAQGAGALNTVGLNNYNAGLQSALAAATARNQSLFPYASVATSLARQPNGASGAASALSSMGSSLLGGSSGSPLSGISNLVKQYLSGGSGASGAAGVGGIFDPSYAGYIPNNTSAASSALSGFQQSVDPAMYNSQGFMDLSGSGFSGAGGQAAGAVGDFTDPALAGAADTAYGAGSGVAGATGSLGGDAAASAASSAGGGSSLSGLAAAWPAAIGVGGILGMGALENHNSIQSNASMMGLSASNAAGIRAAAANPANSQFASSLQSAANLQDWLQQQYANGNINAETDTNSFGLGGLANPIRSMSQSRGINLS